MVVLVGLVGAAAVAAVAGDDPAQPDCGGGWMAVGSVFAGPDSGSSTPMEAATAALDGMQVEDKVVAGGAELVELPVTEDPASSPDSRVAAQVDGKTVVVFNLSKGVDGWDVESYLSC